MVTCCFLWSFILIHAVRQALKRFVNVTDLAVVMFTVNSRLKKGGKVIQAFSKNFQKLQSNEKLMYATFFLLLTIKPPLIKHSSSPHNIGTVAYILKGGSIAGRFKGRTQKHHVSPSTPALPHYVCCWANFLCSPPTVNT